MPMIDRDREPREYIGIDPGASGGLAGLFDGVPQVYPMPKTSADVWEWFHAGGSNGSSTVAVIEKVGGFIQGNPAPGSAMFKFGHGVGILHGCLIAAGIPFEEVTPQKWQKALGIATRRKNETKTQFKNRLKDFAQKLFPGVKLTLATADAILIALYCKRKAEGLL